ncbi:MAG: hypothetical protein WCO55_01490 [Candidatus Falkowbacteria bacterium]
MTFEKYKPYNEPNRDNPEAEAQRLSGQRRTGTPAGPIEKFHKDFLSKDSWKQRADCWLGRTYSKIAHEATVMGEYTDAQGVKYKPDSQGYFRAELKSTQGGEMVEGGQLLEIDGRPVKAMNNFSRSFYEGRHSAKGIQEQDISRSQQESQKLEENMKKYTKMSEGELFSQAAITPNEDNKRAIYMTLMKLGGFRPKDEAVMAEAKRLFDAKPQQAKEFMKLAREKAPWAVHDNLSDKQSGQRESLTTDFKTGKVKLSSYNVEGAKPSFVKNVQDAAYDALGPGEYVRQNKALRHEGNENSRHEIAMAQIAAANAWEKQYLNQLSKEAYAEAYQRTMAEGYSKEIAERNASAYVVEQAEEIMDKVLANRKSLVLRSAAADLTGDVKTAFMCDTPKGRLFNARALRNYLQSSNSESIGNIDLNNEKDPQVINLIISSLSGAQVMSAFKGSDNRENIIRIAKLMALNNHPDAEKFQSYINSLSIDSDEIRANAAMGDLIAKSSGIFENKMTSRNNLQLLNMLRQNHEALGILKYDNKGVLTKDSFERAMAQTKRFMAELKAHTNNGGTMSTFKGAADNAWKTRI